MKLTFSGDIAFVHNVPANFYIDNSLNALYRNSDYNFGCLEAPMCDETCVPITKIGPNLRQTASVQKILSYFTHLSLANNHSMDYGEEGLNQTISSLKEQNIVPLGAGSNYEDIYRPLILTQGEVSVAIFCLAETQYGCFKYPCDEVGYAWILNSKCMQAIVECRSKVNQVILFAHAGLENEHLPLVEWRYIYRQFIDAGVDLIVAGHPHVIQGKEIYKGKTIYYSLGNFFFNERWFLGKDENTHSIVVECDIEKDTIKTTEHFYCYNEYSIVGATEAIVEKFNQMSDLLKNENWSEYWELYTQMCVRKWNELYKELYAWPEVKPKYNIPWIIRKYYQVMRLFARHFFLPKVGENGLFHNIICDTHRFVVSRACSTIANVK